MNPVVVVHGGGASHIGKDRKEIVRQGVLRAATAGYGVLKAGGSAVDAVESAVVVLEDDPEFNAGCGSVLNVNGDVEMDASIMSGKDLSSGAVSAVRCIANPVRLARLVMEKTPHCFLTDRGAAEFAAAMGVQAVPREQLVTERNRRRLEKEKCGKGAQKPEPQKRRRCCLAALEPHPSLPAGLAGRAPARGPALRGTLGSQNHKAVGWSVCHRHRHLSLRSGSAWPTAPPSTLVAHAVLPAPCCVLPARAPASAGTDVPPRPRSPLGAGRSPRQRQVVGNGCKPHALDRRRPEAPRGKKRGGEGRTASRKPSAGMSGGTTAGVSRPLPG